MHDGRVRVSHPASRRLDTVRSIAGAYHAMSDKDIATLFKYMTPNREDLQAFVIDKVIKERQRQDTKWGPQHHPVYKWLAILGEEFGEASEAALEVDAGSLEFTTEDIIAELIQVAAVAIAAVEDLESS